MPFFIRNDIRIHYNFHNAHEEDMETILLIHGTGFDLTSWRLIIPYFSQHYRIVAYDLRGHGLSDKGLDKINKNLVMGDVTYLLDQLKINKVHIVAHGAGSIIAILFGVLFPERVKTHSLLSIPIFSSSKTLSKINSYRSPMIEDTESTRALAEHIISNVTLYPQDSSEVQSLYEAFSRVSPQAYFEFWEGYLVVHHEIFDLFKKNTVPTLVLTGELDPLYPPYLSSLITMQIRNSRYMLVYGSSNMVFYDQPLETFNNIKRFYESQQVIVRDVDPFLKELHSDFIADIGTSKNSKNTIEVHLLDQFKVCVNGEVLLSGWNQRNAKALIIYLVFNRSVTRSQICDDLWSNTDIVKAKSQLRVYLTHLRKTLRDHEYNLLIMDNEHIHLNGEVKCDLIDFIQELNRVENEGDYNHKAALCESLINKISPNYFRNLSDDWIQYLRSSLEDRIDKLCKEMSNYYLEKDDCIKAKATLFLEATLKIHPDEEVIRQLIRLYQQRNLTKDVLRLKQFLEIIQ
ncbi:alpha/beta fold hydrolase [Paenibacillus sp. FSL E2-0230]|uniref:alpha/beta fold hydrolase n=1 Tax=Paenibacillus sp. FSL E2-0230 TaxID=2954727 RepID=UPI0030D34D52